MMDYVAWRGDLSFEQDELNEIDALILSELSYIDFSGIAPASFAKEVTIAAASEAYFKKNPETKGKLGIIVPDTIHDLLRAAAASARFGGIGMSGYESATDEAEEKQFAAVTFTLGENLKFAAFRGTDDSIVGWKENFNMCYLFPVPAQVCAADYLNRLAAACPHRLVTGGHSKGGNLAVYAAEYCEDTVQSRIAAVYNNDGPGFPDSQLENERYLRIRGRMHTFLPQQSIVGILLQHEEDFHAVKSTAVGPMQHDGFSWELVGRGFAYAPALAASSRRTDKTLRAWVDDMDMEQREQFICKLFAIRRTSKALSLTDLAKNPRELFDAINASFDEESRAVLKRSFSMLLHEDRNVKLQDAQEELLKLKDDLTAKAQDVKRSILSKLEGDK